MKTIEYRSMDKSAWSDGPWQSEPDVKQWPDTATGLPCLIVRNSHLGVLCGYVGVPKAHPAYGAEYDAIPVTVHGGLSFAEGEPDLWWLGFNCGHAFDYWPFHGGDRRPEEYRDFAYVEAECARLAQQLAALDGAEATA